MSEASRDQAASAENHQIGPDYFSFYTREVAAFLSQEEDFLPLISEASKLSRTFGEIKDRDVTEKHLNGSCGRLFSNSIGSGLSDFKRERLKRMLREGVVSLSQEVDVIMDPVLVLHQIHSHLQNKKHQSSHSGASSDGDEGKFPRKKQKTSSSSSIGVPIHAGPFDIETDKEVNADLLMLIENNSSLAAETMKRHSAELSATLKHMEQQLEELLDIVMSKCRPMTLVEKHQLQNLIQKLPPRNLDRVAEIIQHGKPEGARTIDEVFVDLEKMDNVTLWRLYYYTEAVESARKCSR